MHIAYLITRFDSIGGAQVHVRDLAQEMLARGHRVTIVTGRTGAVLERLRSQGVECYEVSALCRSIHPVRDLLAVFKIRSLLREFKPDLLSTHSSKAGIVGRVAGWLTGVPTLFTAHGWAFTEGVGPLKAFFFRAVERIVTSLGSKIITVSEFDRRLALEGGVARGTKLVAIHNGMPDIQDGLSADPMASPVRLVMVARFQQQKDHGTLLRALAGMMDEQWSLDLLGDGPECKKIKDLARRLGLTGRVSFCGARNDVAEFLSRSQVFVLVSNWEGFPRTILEAMRAGLPVVASDVGGVSEAVEDGVNGYLIPKADVEVLQERLGGLFRNPELRKTMGAAGRASYEKQFRFEQMLEKTCKIYEEVSL